MILSAVIASDRRERSNLSLTDCFVAALLAMTMLAGCNKSPFDRTHDASNGGATGTFSGTTNFMIFNNELVSGGGAFEYPGGENQSLSFNDTSNPISRRSIRYNWTGQAVSAPGCNPNPESTFAGFDLMYTPTVAQYDSTNATKGRNLRMAGYTKVTFYARGGLSTNTVLKVEVASSGNPPGCPVPVHAPCVTFSTNGTDDDPNFPCGRTAPLTGSWQSFSIPVANSDLANVKDFFKATYIFNPVFGALAGQGGTIYFDVIQYQP